METQSELNKMLSGALYDPMEPELVAAHRRARRLVRQLNEADPDKPEDHIAILNEMLGGMGKACWVEPPFQCDYGTQIYLGDKVFLNGSCIILDCARVEIGSNTMLGPAVQIYTATHPMDPDERATGLEMARPIRIGRDVWIGGASVICPGVSIGDGSTIGAGSVVTRDVPSRVFAAGNPCRVIREL